MTRTEIETEYQVENDMIRSPGKFEGESILAVYFYAAFLDGMADDQDENADLFTITDEDRAAFPGLIPDDARTARLTHHESGFVTLSYHH